MRLFLAKNAEKMRLLLRKFTSKNERKNSKKNKKIIKENSWS